MSVLSRGRRRLPLLLVLAALAALAAPAGAGAVAQILPGQAGLADRDTRTGTVAASGAQRRAVRTLGARVTWNRSGTPASLLPRSGALTGRQAGSPAAIARRFVLAQRGLFRLSVLGVRDLELVGDQPLAGGAGHAVLLRQRFGGLPAGTGGLLTVGVAGGRVHYVSSSAAGDQAAPAAARLSPVAAWLRAAADVGVKATAADVGAITGGARQARFDVAGLVTPQVQQRSRLVAFPTFGKGIRPAFETIVLDVDGGEARAYRSFVDARTGKILKRENAVKQAEDDEAPAGSFSGSTGEGCGPAHPVVARSAHSLGAFASATLPTDDIVVKLLRPDGGVLASSDTLTSPEAVTYAAPGGGTLPDGTYAVQVCRFDAGPAVAYTGGYLVNTVAAVPATEAPDPAWRYFAASPPIDHASADTRIRGCFVTAPGCDVGLNSLAARGPWDTIGGLPTFTTTGNAARTAEARTSPLTPGPYGFQPVSAQRDYDFPFANQWHETKCDPTALAVPGQGADVSAAVTNLFAGHNRIHDYAYFLGFTERNYNLQVDNGGKGGMGGDPELGNVQAGALTGGAPSYLGRDNANQIALGDGIPGITNQYLFQPIAGAFYSPCADGSLDTSIYGHEYTHAISNRMVGGPEDGLSGLQAGSMGESWSDLVAVEYLQAQGDVPVGGENPWAVGVYATGNRDTGIRDYALDANPLNYSDVGFDTSGPEVHADGEIWNAVNYDLRQAFVKRYDARFPSTDAALQLRCADGRPGTDAPEPPLSAEQCPGNRRWVQLMFDAFLLQQGDTSFLTARDAFLAADRMRFGGANQDLIWDVFARRGMGASAATDTTEDDDPTPGFDSPLSVPATVTFTATDSRTNAAVAATVHVGHYQARTTPVADTDGATPLGAAAPFTAGRYDLVVRAPGYGLQRTTLTVKAGQRVTKALRLAPNLASAAKGATASGPGTDLGNLIDDDEGTTWDWTGDAPVSEAKPAVTVNLRGAKRITSVAVSALLDPDDADADETRFTALRSFRVETCDGRTANCAAAGSWKTALTSADDAFPGVAPRPVAPDLTLRRFAIPATYATQVRLVATDNQCTGGPAYQGEQDADPANATDCVTGSESGTVLHAAELQVFG